MWSNMTKVNVKGTNKTNNVPDPQEEEKEPESPLIESDGVPILLKEHSMLPEKKKTNIAENEIPKYSSLPGHNIEEEDLESDNLFGLMEQIKGCREQNKNMNDEQRRQNAEEIMSKLAGMMDLGSDGEDEHRDYDSEH